MDLTDIRIYKGRNIHCLKPVIRLTVRLSPAENAPTSQIEGFGDRLLALFPGLLKHQCALGHEGGFVERLREGTYPGHVAEHTILELQNILGYDLAFGTTRQVKGTLNYHIVYRYENEQVGVACGKAVIRLISGLMHGETVDFPPVLEELRTLAARTDMGPSTRAIYEEALRRSIPVTRLGCDSQLQFGYGKYARRMESSLSDKPSCIAVNTAGDKHLTKELLRRHGISVPTGEIVYSLDSALRCAGEIGYPVVVKPYDSNHGNGVTLDIENAEEIPEAFEKAMGFSTAAVVEKFIHGRDYRVLVVGGKVSAVAERKPPFVTGDGASTIRQLVDRENENPLRGDDHTKPLTTILLDGTAIDELLEQDLTPDSVLQAGEVISLRKNANLSTGGTARSCPQEIHPDNAACAVRAAQIVGLDIAGVDVCSPDISVPLKQNHGAIIEVNAGPGLRMHVMPSEGPPAQVAKDILDMLYPPGAPYTIPLAAVTGTNGKTTVVRLIAHTLALTGRKVGYTTTSGIYLNDSCILKGDNTGAVSASLVLSHPEAEAAVLETARGGILRRGLGYDLADVGVITNVTEDHLGLDGIETLEDLAYVKALVIEAVKPRGCAVLNADDAMTPYFLERARCNVFLFSRNVNNPLLQSHLQRGENAAFFHEGALHVQYLSQPSLLMRVTEVPITYNGTAFCNIENALAACAALMGLGIPLHSIRRGLATFTPDEKHNPGRFNIFEGNGLKVMLDYGHNIAGYEQAIAFLEKQGARRLVGVIGVPGDRQDAAVKKIGALCAQHFQKLYIKEDIDLRGRKPGVVAELLKSAAQEANPQIDLRICLREEDALKQALDSGQAGDFITVFYERYEPLKSLILAHHMAERPMEVPAKKFTGMNGEGAF